MVIAAARSVVAKGRLVPPAEALVARFSGLVVLAERHGFRVDGLHLTRAFLNDAALARMESLVFNEAALKFLHTKGARIEFIVEGPLPPELLRESPLKREAVFRSVIGYDICKSCRLCIEVCPRRVYGDDGFGRPDQERRQEEECTGPTHCNRCADICPEHTITIVPANLAFAATVFVLLENPFARALAEAEAGCDLYVANPLEVGRPLTDAADFHPVFEIGGVERHLVDSTDRENDLRIWAKENSRDPELVLQAVRLLYDHLSQIAGLKEGKCTLKTLVNRIADEIILAEVDLRSDGGLELLKNIIEEAYVAEAFFGAKRRPIGGLLPPGTSPAWKTPYGAAVPEYVRPGDCVGPECALCVMGCPEGSGGETSAVKMVSRVPLGTIPSLTRGLEVFVLRLDGSHAKPEDLEDLTGQTPFEFRVNTDYCKSCGTCIACCPHNVIDSTARTFDLRARLK